MKDEELERLLWELGDGAISAGDRARLEAHLAASPGARRRQREVEALTHLLSTVGEVAAPAGLNERIARAIAERQRPQPRPSWTDVVRDVLAARWRVRLAWASVGLLAGAAIATLAISDFGESQRDVSQYYGALGNPRARGSVIETALPGGRGTLLLEQHDGALTVELGAAGTAGDSLRVEVSGAPLGVAAFEASKAAASRLEAAAGVVAGELLGSGRLVMRLTYHEQGQTLVVRVLAGEEELLRRELAAAHAGAN